jgi:hypothetical protein
MAYENIIESVDQSIEQLCKEFRSRPTLFYSEHDMVSFFYTLLLRNLPVSKAYDRDGSEHLLVHLEYPLPFRCVMSGETFEVKEDNDQTPEGVPYERGYCPLVVLNPDYVTQYPYDYIKVRDYELYKKAVLPHLDKTKPAVLYGVQLVFHSDPFPLLQEERSKEAIGGFSAEVNKRADQLVAAQAVPGFMDRIKVLTFIKGGADEVRTFLFKTLSERVEVLVCFSY